MRRHKQSDAELRDQIAGLATEIYVAEGEKRSLRFQRHKCDLYSEAEYDDDGRFIARGTPTCLHYNAEPENSGKQVELCDRCHELRAVSKEIADKKRRLRLAICKWLKRYPGVGIETP